MEISLCHGDVYVEGIYTSDCFSALILNGFEGNGISILTIMNHKLEFVRIQPNEKEQEVLELVSSVFYTN